MRKLSLVLAGLVLAVAVAGCGGGTTGPGGGDGYEEDFYPVDLRDEYGIELIHPGFGWVQTRNSAGDLRWKEDGDDGEFRIRVTGGIQNPYQDRVDMFGGWDVIEEQELEFDGLEDPAKFVHAWKDEDGFEVGALQLSFSRRFRGLHSPFYYIITLWNYDYTFHASYEEIFQEVLDALVIYSE